MIPSTLSNLNHYILRYLTSPGISFVIFERATGLGEVGVELLVVNNG